MPRNNIFFDFWFLRFFIRPQTYEMGVRIATRNEAPSMKSQASTSTPILNARETGKSLVHTKIEMKSTKEDIIETVYKIENIVGENVDNFSKEIKKSVAEVVNEKMSVVGKSIDKTMHQMDNTFTTKSNEIIAGVTRALIIKEALKVAYDQTLGMSAQLRATKTVFKKSFAEMTKRLDLIKDLPSQSTREVVEAVRATQEAAGKTLEIVSAVPGQIYGIAKTINEASGGSDMASISSIFSFPNETQKTKSIAMIGQDPKLHINTISQQKTSLLYFVAPVLIGIFVLLFPPEKSGVKDKIPLEELLQNRSASPGKIDKFDLNRSASPGKIDKFDFEHFDREHFESFFLENQRKIKDLLEELNLLFEQNYQNLETLMFIKERQQKLLLHLKHLKEKNNSYINIISKDYENHEIVGSSLKNSEIRELFGCLVESTFFLYTMNQFAEDFRSKLNSLS